MTMIPQKKILINENYKIILSISDDLKDKETTFYFKKIELKSLYELMQTMNNNAVSNGLFLNGHRNRKNIKAMGNVYFIDIDNEPKSNEPPYYLEIENKLKDLNISFISVPSQNADKYPYKRHIAVILENNLPVSKKEYLKAVHEIINKIGIDLNKIDFKVQENQINFLAPCKVNQNFKDHELKSYFFNGKPLLLEENTLIKESNIYNENSLKDDIFVTFSDGSRLSISQAKLIITQGTKKECYCPLHDDKKPSASYYHNLDGTVNIYCSVCGSIKINKKDFFPKPKINHSSFNYSISILFINKEVENHLKRILGIDYQNVENHLVWFYKIDSINDIYLLMLAKIQLLKDGYSLTNFYIKNRGFFADIQLLRTYTRNTKPLPCFINKTTKTTPFIVLLIKIKKAVFGGYIFPELIIWEIYQTFLEINSLKIVCNFGLGFFDYVIDTINNEDKELKLQKDKKFPIKSDRKQKQISNELREKERIKTVIENMNLKEEKIYKLIKSGKYNKLNGDLNKSLLSQKLNISRPTLDKYLKVMDSKNR